MGWRIDSITRMLGNLTITWHCSEQVRQKYSALLRVTNCSAVHLCNAGGRSFHWRAQHGMLKGSWRPSCIFNFSDSGGERESVSRFEGTLSFGYFNVLFKAVSMPRRHRSNFLKNIRNLKTFIF